MEKSRSGNCASRPFAKQPRGPIPKPALRFGVSARRAFLKAALLAGLGLPLVDEALGDESPAANERPREGDLFVFAEGEHKGSEIKPGDLPLGGPQVLAWPKDPKSGVVRDGSRLNQVLLLRLDPASLNDETRAHAAEGAVAYSAICTHAQCPVDGWVEDQGRHVLKCFCHNSEYDPQANAKVIFGPAPRGLPALPVRINDGVLLAAGTFLGKVGFRPG
jgi:Rieske Fe-S protein